MHIESVPHLGNSQRFEGPGLCQTPANAENRRDPSRADPESLRSGRASICRSQCPQEDLLPINLPRDFSK